VVLGTCHISHLNLAVKLIPFFIFISHLIMAYEYQEILSCCNFWNFKVHNTLAL